MHAEKAPVADAAAAAVNCKPTSNCVVALGGGGPLRCHLLLQQLAARDCRGLWQWGCLQFAWWGARHGG